MADKEIDIRKCKHLILYPSWCLLKRDYCSAIGGVKCPNFVQTKEK